MSLTAEDLSSIRTIVNEESREVFQNDGREMMRDILQTEGRQIVHESVHAELSKLEGKVTALENDVKEVYFILARLEKSIARHNRKFQKLKHSWPKAG